MPVYFACLQDLLQAPGQFLWLERHEDLELGRIAFEILGRSFLNAESTVPQETPLLRSSEVRGS